MRWAGPSESRTLSHFNCNKLLMLPVTGAYLDLMYIPRLDFGLWIKA